MVVDPSKFLLPEDDGLPMRESSEYVSEKLRAVSTYLKMATTAVRNTNWRERFYIDLQSGPGKNVIRSTGEVLMGSPLLALTTNPGFTRLRLNELYDEPYQALAKRVSVSDTADQIKIYQKDLNVAVEDICQEIEAIDNPFIKDVMPSFNIAFLDPEGLELEWSTVERLAGMKRMDLIINFSTSGIKRSEAKDYLNAVDKFFGTRNWKSVFDSASNNLSAQRRALIDYYLERLKEHGYHIKSYDYHKRDIQIRNSKNTEIYSLIFASKHPLGDKLWREVVRRSGPQDMLPGFE